MLGDPAEGPVVAATAEPRCLAGRATLAVRAVNEEDGPLDVALATAFGDKAFTDVAPGTAAYQSFATRVAAIEAGTVTVTASDGGGRTSETSVQYPALTCG